MSTSYWESQVQACRHQSLCVHASLAEVLLAHSALGKVHVAPGPSCSDASSARGEQASHCRDQLPVSFRLGHRLNVPASEGVVALRATERFYSTVYNMSVQGSNRSRTGAYGCVHGVADALGVRTGVGSAGIGSVFPSSPMRVVLSGCLSPLHGKEA